MERLRSADDVVSVGTPDDGTWSAIDGGTGPES